MYYISDEGLEGQQRKKGPKQCQMHRLGPRYVFFCYLQIYHLPHHVMKEGLGTRAGVRERVWRVRVWVTKSKPSSNPYPFWRVTGLCHGSASRQPPAGYNSHSYS